MPDIADLMNNIFIQTPIETVGMDSIPPAARPNADFEKTGRLPADSSRPLDTKDSFGADDDNSTGQVREKGGENFREVLEKRLSEKQKPDSGPEPDQTPAATTDEASSQNKDKSIDHLKKTTVTLVGSKALQNSDTSKSPLAPLSMQNKVDSKAKPSKLLSQKQAQPTGFAGNAPATKVAKESGTKVKKTDANPQRPSASTNKAAPDKDQTPLQLDTSLNKPAPHSENTLTDGKSSFEKSNTPDLMTAMPKVPPPDDAKAKLVSVDANKGIPNPKSGQAAAGKNQTKTGPDQTQSGTQKNTTDAGTAFETTRAKAITDSDSSTGQTLEMITAGAKAQSAPSTITTGRLNSVNPLPAAAGTGYATGLRHIEGSRLGPAEQIIENVRLNLNNPQQEIFITLNPPELGKVRMMFRQIDGQITGLIEADKSQTRYEIERSLPQIVASLQESGVNVRRMDVMLNNQNQHTAQNKNNDMPDGFVGMDKHTFDDRPADNGSNRPDSPKNHPDGSLVQSKPDNPNVINDNTINIYV
jgi:flagellar hook-length control protein FliK